MRSAYCFATLACLTLGLCLASPPAGSCVWAGLATSYFALFTTDRHENGKDVLELLETARLFFEHSGWAPPDLKQPVDILAFSSGSEFESYRINPGAFAFYQPTRQGDFVIMRALERQHYSVVVHEYTHYVVRQLGYKLPLWLNEGLADFYSTLECHQTQVVLGYAPPGREDALRRSGWIDWGTMAAVDQHSPYYQQPEKMFAFYAQSWATARLLALDPVYADKFRDFLAALTAGATTEAALTAVYNKTLPEIGREVEASMGSKTVAPRILDVDVRPGALQTAEVADRGTTS